MFDAITVSNNQCHVIFTAFKDFIYTVQFKDAVDATNWTDLTTLSLPATNAQIMIIDSLVTNRMFRLLRQ